MKTVLRYGADICDVLVAGVTDNVLTGDETRLYEAGKKTLW